MNIKISKREKGIIGICGHVGVGHIHSHSGFVQDDSAGLCVAATILKEALEIDTIIDFVEVDLCQSTISVKTKDGGLGKVWVRRGITPNEEKMIKKIVGEDAIYSQRIVLNTLGRIYGQGAMEVPVSLQGAISLALIDTFQKKWPDKVIVVNEDISSNIGKVLGAVIDIQGIPVSIMLTVNGSRGGIGPIEDLEGNIILGDKGKLMQKIGLDKIPTIIIESMNFSPGNCNLLKENSFLIRANRKFDNTIVADCLFQTAKKLGIDCGYEEIVLARETENFNEAVIQFGKRIEELGKKFQSAKTSEEKVEIISELAIIVSEDAGGVTFMSNKLQRDVGSAGMIKGTSAVISFLVTKEYIEYYKVPFMTEKEVKEYIRIIYNGIPKLYNRLNEAQEELEKKFSFNEEDYKYLFA